MFKQPFFDLLKLVCDEMGYTWDDGVQREMAATDSRLG